jgi:hypothetical protein
MNTKTRRLTSAALLASFCLTGLSVSAVAEDNESTATSTVSASELQAANLRRAQESNDEALDEALDKVLERTRLDLDIRLLDHKSETVATAN